MKVRITETVLRDAHQSLLATRLRTEDMLPVCQLMDTIGYWSVEVWGGATFDACLRFLKEDPWERVSLIKQEMPKTPLQMLLRGQNLVGYRHYADDVVERFVERAHARGIDVFRIFDALNDTRNLRVAMKAVKRVGAHVEGCIAYTTSPVHDVEAFAKMAQRLTEMEADTICIKDMAGLLAPYAALDLVKRIREASGLPVHVHSHSTSGMASATYLKAIEGGARMIDTAISSMSMGTSQPATESMVAMLRASPHDSGLSLKKLAKVAEYFKEVRKRYKEFETDLPQVDTLTLTQQIPGGMMSNLIAQLREAGKEDKLDEVLEEVPRVRADMGYIPLVTPTSQMVGTQATLNVIYGERYKMVSSEVRNLVRGLYGKTPAEIRPQVRQRIIGDEMPVTVRPADLLEPELEKARQQAGDLAQSEEDVLSFALFPQVAPLFFKARAEGAVSRPKKEFTLTMGSDLHGQAEAKALAEELNDVLISAISSYLALRSKVMHRPLQKVQRNVWSVAAKYERIGGMPFGSKSFGF